MYKRVQAGRSSKEAGTTRLDGIDFCLREAGPPEASWELVTVKVFTLLGLDRTERSSALSADKTSKIAALLLAAHERTVLMGLGAVGCKGLGERAGGRSRVDPGCVVDVWCSC